MMRKLPNHIKLWFVELDGNPISTAINLHWNGNIDGWAMASKPNYFKLKPTVVLITEMIRTAIETNERVFDLGPNLGKQSIIDFKKRFGAEVIPYRIWYRKGMVMKLVETIRTKK